MRGPLNRHGQGQLGDEGAYPRTRSDDDASCPNRGPVRHGEDGGVVLAVHVRHCFSDDESRAHHPRCVDCSMNALFGIEDARSGLIHGDVVAGPAMLWLAGGELISV